MAGDFIGLKTDAAVDVYKSLPKTKCDRQEYGNRDRAFEKSEKKSDKDGGKISIREYAKQFTGRRQARAKCGTSTKGFGDRNGIYAYRRLRGSGIGLD